MVLESFEPRSLFAMKMLQKLMPLGIVLLLTGIVPVLAYGGSCARMPCCHPNDRIIIQANSGCCSPAMCVRETAGIKSAEDAKRPQKQFANLLAIMTGPAVAVPEAEDLCLFIALAIPRHIDRLALLSILLI